MEDGVLKYFDRESKERELKIERIQIEQVWLGYVLLA